MTAIEFGTLLKLDRNANSILQLIEGGIGGGLGGGGGGGAGWEGCYTSGLLQSSELSLSTLSFGIRYLGF